MLYVVKITGFWDKIGSVESLRKYVSGFGAYAVIIFIAIQFLQVVVLPVPGFITVSAGVLLFGAFRGSLYSVIGIVTASIVAFFIGRVFGYKVAEKIKLSSRLCFFSRFSRTTCFALSQDFRR